ncbi:MAG TPA: serine/threonine-protein kinase [Actinocrinis sp.]|uniref:serine/threonine-protein kinase n=1 Tax=Actinocrinis sp. TaxID=1920516 RepID=UPI002DDD0FD8|nr:serine/threonine-protein kinase [Actinocrinis sp.]HEV2347269.1 serine/threonine-protein kinase [Actinocrinis sp.]
MNAGGSGRDLVDGRFELLERLGGGGMGLVWRARDTMLQREVALKEVRPAQQVFDDDPVAAHVLRERVLREARALARLHHPNVVTIYHIVDSVEHQHPWLVMELVTGGSLDDRIKRGPLPPQEVAHIGRGVLAALRAAHAAGIQHRDVKPANVLLHLDGTPVLTDFGIAALSEANSLTQTGALVGSPEYVAPERIRGQEGDPASDLWSLGMMMYVALEGYNPLHRDTTLATLAAVLDSRIPEPIHAGSLTPVLRELLVRDPAARPDAPRLDHLLAYAEQGAISMMYGNAAAAYVSPIPPFGPSGAAYGPEAAFGPTDAVYAQNGAGNAPTPYASASSSGNVNVTSGPRRRRTAAFVASITGTAAVGLALALVWTLHDSPASASTGNNGNSGNNTGGVSSTASPSAGTSGGASPSASADGGGGGDQSQASNLLTPAGARALVNVIHQQLGNRKIIELVLYPDYAALEAETASDPTLYDEYWYRGGNLTRESGGTITDEVPVDLSAVNWNALPTLLSAAGKQLKIPHPTSQYVIVEGNWIDQGPGLGIYLGDDYGSAYLLADLKGRIIESFPRS